MEMEKTASVHGINFRCVRSCPPKIAKQNYLAYNSETVCQAHHLTANLSTIVNFQFITIF